MAGFNQTDGKMMIRNLKRVKCHEFCFSSEIAWRKSEYNFFGPSYCGLVDWWPLAKLHYLPSWFGSRAWRLIVIGWTFIHYTCMVLFALLFHFYRSITFWISRTACIHSRNGERTSLNSWVVFDMRTRFIYTHCEGKYTQLNGSWFFVRNLTIWNLKLGIQLPTWIYKNGINFRVILFFCFSTNFWWFNDTGE